jgi:hypothetical protein
MDPQQVQPTPTAPAAGVSTPFPRQAFAGLTPPQVGEARIREVWPSLVARMPGVSHLAQRLICSIFLAPLGWMLLALPFVLRIAPGLARRYTLTNRRLMIQKGLRPAPEQEIALADIDDVRFDPATYSSFYRCGTLAVIAKGQTAMTLLGVPEPESFRHSILNACKAWIPGKANGPFIPASAGGK